MVTITANQIGKRYKKHWVFQQFSYQFVPGSRTALLGANGSGKSTLLRTLIGFASATSGQVAWEHKGDIEMDQWHNYYAFAGPYLELFEEYSLREMVDFHFKLKSIREGIDLNDILERANLQKHMGKALGSFSSGMLQRVKLILALCSNVNVFLLDEPCSNLDNSGVEFYNYLVNQIPEHSTLIVASNDTKEYAMCSKQIHMEDYKPTS